MTRRIGGVVLIEPTPPEPCARCGQARECRDLLGDGKPVCFFCATPAEREAYSERLFGGDCLAVFDKAIGDDERGMN